MSTLMPNTITTPQFHGPRPTWLWPHRIPLGKITLLAGDPGLGKSFIALDLAARLSAGLPMPHSSLTTDHCPLTTLPPSDTLLFSAEDELHDTILPRLAALNADPARIHPIRCLDSHQQYPQPFSLKTDLAELTFAIEEHCAQLLIFDPITAFMDGIDLNSTSHIRQFLTPLAHLAAFYNTAILAITHLNKNKESHRQSLYRPAGSLALAAIARSVHLVHPAPSRTHNLLSPIKSNLTTPLPALPFRLTNSTLEWLPCSHRPTDGACPPTQDSGLPTQDSPDFFEHHDRQLALDYLTDALSTGPKPAIPLIRQAKKLAISERTLKRAKAQLGILSKKSGRNEWHWLKPDQSVPTEPAV